MSAECVAENIPPGYKQTEVGVIPEDWEAKTLDSIAFVTSGKRLPLGQSLTEYETPHPYIRVTDMRPGTVSSDDIKFVPVDVFPAIRRYRIFKDDIFISVAGTLGIVGKVPSQLDGANLTENANRITNITCSQDYILYILMSPLIQNTIDSLQTVGAQPKLALTRIRKFLIPLPPTKAEQEAIAEALSGADAFIESLEQLIAKKSQIKQGAMQELLTGKRRLPGFATKAGYKHTEVGVIPEDWNFDCIENLAHITTGGKNTQDRVDDGQYPFFVRSQKIERINSYSYDGEAVLTAGDGVGTGKVFHYIKGKFDVHQRVYLISDFNPHIDGYFFFLYFSTHFYNRIMQMTAKSSVDSVRREMISRMLVPLPSLSEQTAITTILSDMDTELIALEEKLAKARQLKQGMMQELLTGRVRLI